MASKNHEKFLTNYKNLESILATKTKEDMAKISWISEPTDNMTVYDLENHSTQEMMNKLRVCRVLRNYAQHNADAEEFLAISDKEVLFLDNVISAMKNTDPKLKDKMKRITCPTVSDPVSSVLGLLLQKKIPYCPVTDTDGILKFVVSEHDICVWLNSGITLKTKLSKVPETKNNFLTGSTTDSYLDFVEKNGDNLMIVVKDGNEVVKGIIYEKS